MVITGSRRLSQIHIVQTIVFGVKWEWRIPPFAADALEVLREAAEERVARTVAS